MLSNVAGANPCEVIVLGYRNVGGAAAHLAAAMGANVNVFGTREDGLRKFKANAPPNISCFINQPDLLEQKILTADVVIGAILISTHDTPPMTAENLVSRMKKGSVIVDVTCGYGSGYMPTFDKLTSHKEPFFERFGVLHCKIDSMPSSVPLTATQATSTNVWPYLMSLANHVLKQEHHQVCSYGLLLANGKIIHPELQRHLEMKVS